MLGDGEGAEHVADWGRAIEDIAFVNKVGEISARVLLSLDKLGQRHPESNKQCDNHQGSLHWPHAKVARSSSYQEIASCHTPGSLFALCRDCQQEASDP